MENIKTQRMSQFLATEHSTLQGMRSSTISEANGRLSTFLSTVSTGIVALALVAQVAGIGQFFLMFSLIIFPILLFLGLTTQIRLIQVGVMDVLLSQAINRVRHFYLDTVPEIDQYLTVPPFDDTEAIRQTVLPFGQGNEQFSSSAAQAAVINSFLFGVFGTILAAGLFSLNLIVTIAIGIFVVAVVMVLNVRYAATVRKTFLDRMEVRFPTPNI